jgi:hypothetical protein
MSSKEIDAGYRSRLHVALVFVRWAQAHQTPITWQAIKDRFGCSRATAYRWLQAWHDEIGKEQAVDGHA